MRRVLFIIDSLTCGGAEKSLVSLLPLIDYGKVEVDLMIVNRGGVFERYIPSNVHVVPFPTVKGLRRLWFVACRLAFSVLLRVFPKRHGAELRWMAMSSAYPRVLERYDVAIAYQQGFPTYYVASKVSAGNKIAWINVDLRKAGYIESYNRKFYDLMTCSVSVSDTLYEMLCHSSYADSAKLMTIYDILNVDMIRKMSQEGGFDDTLPQGTFRIVTVGRMTVQKNYALAVESAARLRERGLSFRWYFIGDGAERPRIESVISRYGLGNEIRLLGMLPNPYPYMAGCDIYVQTSSFEGFGLTLAEARILHKPVVSTNFAVVYDQIRDGENGLVCNMDAESVSDKILLLAGDSVSRDRLIKSTMSEENQTSVTESRKVNELLVI